LGFYLIERIILVKSVKFVSRRNKVRQLSFPFPHFTEVGERRQNLKKEARSYLSILKRGGKRSLKPHTRTMG